MSELQERYYQAQLEEMAAVRRARRIKRVVWSLLLLGVVLALWDMLRPSSIGADVGKKVIPVVRIGGEIGPRTSLQNLTLSLEKAFELKSGAVILSIDSPGGDPTLAQRFNARLRFLRQKYPQTKVIAVCERLCASAAYMIAIQADEVLAGPYSLVGSIGAVISYTNYSDLMQRLGVRQIAYASGPYKAMLSPMMPVGPQDEQKARQIVAELGEAFAAEVRQRRSQTRQNVIDSGEIWTAPQAMRLGLIDRIGVIEDVAFGDFDGAIPVVIDVGERRLASAVGAWIHNVILEALAPRISF